MGIIAREENNVAIFEISGQSSDAMAIDLDAAIDKELYNGVDKFVFDLTDLENISTAVLRVLFSTSKHVNGNVVIKNANSNVKEFLELSGFDSMFIFE